MEFFNWLSEHADFKNYVLIIHYFAWPAVVWCTNWLIKRSRTKLNEIIAENVDRNRDEIVYLVKQYIDKRFVEHEICDNKIISRLDKIEKKLDVTN